MILHYGLSSSKAIVPISYDFNALVTPVISPGAYFAIPRPVVRYTAKLPSQCPPS